MWASFPDRAASCHDRGTSSAKGAGLVKVFARSALLQQLDVWMKLMVLPFCAIGLGVQRRIMDGSWHCLLALSAKQGSKGLGNPQMVAISRPLSSGSLCMPRATLPLGCICMFAESSECGRTRLGTDIALFVGGAFGVIGFSVQSVAYEPCLIFWRVCLGTCRIGPGSICLIG